MFSLFSHTIFAQSPTFNLVQDYGYPVNQFWDITVNDDTIVGLGIAYPDSFNLTQGIFLAKIDSNGQLLKTNLLFDINGDHLTIDSPSGKITKTSDGGYAFIATPFLRNNAIFFKVNPNLEEEFRYEFIDTINLGSFALRIIETQSGYILYGHITKTNYHRVGIIRHIDKTGNTLWEKKYLYNGIDNYVMDIKPINDSTFVACSIIDIDFDIYKGYSSIRTIDIYGNQLSYWESAVDSEEGHLVSILPTPDNGFIANAKRLYERNANNYKIQSVFMKFDANFNIKWIRHWGRITKTVSALRMYDIYSMLDGSYVSIGKTAQDTDGDGYFYPVGWMMKYSPEGDSLWSRNITLPAPDQVNSNGMYAGGILSSGSIIGGGYAEINGAYFGWIVKLTGDGCLDTLFACQTSPVREVTNPAVGGGLGIYPNPAIDETQIFFPGGTNSNYVIRLTDINGRVVDQFLVVQGNQSVLLPLSQRTNGVYIVEVKRADGFTLRKKLVVAH